MESIEMRFPLQLKTVSKFRNAGLTITIHLRIVNITGCSTLWSTLRFIDLANKVINARLALPGAV